MKISQEELIGILATSLNVNKKKAEEELSQWVDTVQKELEKKGRYHAVGLGTWHLEKGNTVFTPDEKPAIEVNYKYAGMNAIEMVPADARIIEQERGEEPGEIRKDKPEKEEAPDAGISKEPSPEKDVDKHKEIVEEVTAEADEAARGDDAIESMAPEQQQKKSVTENRDQDGSPEPDVESKKKDIKDEKRSTGTNGQEPQSKLWMLPIAAAFLIAILMFIHFDAQILDRRHTVDQTTRTEPRGVPEQGQIQPPEHEIRPVPEEDSSPVDSDLYGLMGPQEETLQGSYTIVLHSITNENRARIEKEKLENEGYKVTVWQARLGDGRLTWRIGVGQFEAVSHAEQAVSRLPDPYRHNNFIIRIR